MSSRAVFVRLRGDLSQFGLDLDFFWRRGKASYGNGRRCLASLARPGRKRMKTIDRRRLIGQLLFGATAAGLALAPGGAPAMPRDDRLPEALGSWVEKAQVVVTSLSIP